MVWSVPAAVEEALWAAARAELSPEALASRTLAAAIVARSHLYTDERERLPIPVAPRARDADLAARALFFTVADAAKIAIPLAELAGRGLLPPLPLRVLDVGAGAGAMTLGLLARASLASVHAVDRDAGALAILRRAAAALAPDLPVDVLASDARAALPAGPFDLVVAGSLMNELAPAARLPLARELLARLDGGGALILIEPALRETARALHELRDAVLAAGLAHVFAPCTRQGPCPALDDARDWCIEDRPFRPPPRLHELIRQTGLRGHSLKLAYLTLRRSPDPLVVAPPGRAALRVVSGPLDAKGTVERLVCGPEGRTKLRVLRRDRGPARDALGSARRGDVLLVAGGEIERLEPPSP